MAREPGVGRSTVKEYLARAAAADLAWPLPDDLTDAVLDERLFAASGSKPGARRRAERDWALLAREMPQPACYCIRVAGGPRALAILPPERPRDFARVGFSAVVRRSRSKGSPLSTAS